MNDAESHILSLPKDDPIRVYVVDQVNRASDLRAQSTLLQQEVDHLANEVLRLETELESAMDYLRLVREERDNLKLQLDFQKNKDKS